MSPQRHNLLPHNSSFLHNSSLHGLPPQNSSCLHRQSRHMFPRHFSLSPQHIFPPQLILSPQLIFSPQLILSPQLSTLSPRPIFTPRPISTFNPSALTIHHRFHLLPKQLDLHSQFSSSPLTTYRLFQPLLKTYLNHQSLFTRRTCGPAGRGPAPRDARAANCVCQEMSGGRGTHGWRMSWTSERRLMKTASPRPEAGDGGERRKRKR